MLAEASSFSSSMAYPSLNILPPLFLRLTPTLIMQGSSSLLNDSSSLSFFNACAPPIRFSPTDDRTNFFSPSSRNLFIPKDFNCNPPSGTQKLLPTHLGRKYSIGLSPLTSSVSITLTYLLFSIAPLAVALCLTSPFLPPPSPYLTFGASGPGFSSPTNSTNRPSFSGLLPQQASLFLQFSESSLE